MKRGDKKAIVIGATGLVGQALVEQLQQEDDFNAITVVVRKNSDILNIEMNPIRHDKKVMPDEKWRKV